MGYNNKLPIDQLIGAYPTCSKCGSEQVLCAASAKWNRASLEWLLQSTVKDYICSDCAHTGALSWQLDEAFRKKRIQRLNDALRHGEAGNNMMVITPGVQGLGEEALKKIMTELATFDAFTEDNDPHGEHDFGALTQGGEKIFWKVDYFDRRLKMHSPDAANPNVTCRVLTIMLAREY